MEVVLETQGLTKRFGGIVAVNNINFKIYKDEILSLIGPNGAGKTTLLNLISGQLKQDEGVIYFLSRRINPLPSYQRARLGISRSYQLSNLFNGLTVFENVRLAAHISRSGKIFTFKDALKFDDVLKEVKEVLDVLGLYDKRNLLVSDLSHGDRRVVEIAMALVQKPKLLLLDEPTAGLSIKETKDFIRVLEKVSEEILSILIVSHDIETVFEVSDRVNVMYEGKIIFDGKPEEVAEDENVQKIYLRRGQ